MHNKDVSTSVFYFKEEVVSGDLGEYCCHTYFKSKFNYILNLKFINIYLSSEHLQIYYKQLYFLLCVEGKESPLLIRHMQNVISFGMSVLLADSVTWLE